MSNPQPDLFSVVPAHGAAPDARSRPPVDPAALDDAALIAAIPEAGLADAPLLAAEAGQRRLAAAVPALEALCRRFTGFGADRLVPEQAAALRALTRISGREAAQAVVRLIVRQAVQGPAVALAAAAAAALGSRLPADVAQSLLRHDDPAIRADACRCARADAVPVLVELLGDLNGAVALAAACALGCLGRAEARPLLLTWLRAAPSAELIEAVTALADEETVVLLGWIARKNPALAPVALDALEATEHPRAAAVLAQLRPPRR